MRRIILLSMISIMFAGGALALLHLGPSLSAKVMARQQGQKLKLSASSSPKHRFDTLESLVERSPEIVVGVPIGKNSYRRSPTDQMIFTDYDVQVLESLKGARQLNRKLKLRVPGGFMALAGGKSIEVSMPDFWKNPEIGKGYIFFLTRGKKDAPFVLVGGPQGAFEISPWPESFSMKALPDFSKGRVVTPQVRDSDELMKNYKGRDAGALIKEIKGMVGPYQPADSASKNRGRNET